MFDKFGEFDSAEEINKKAAELLVAGDTEGVRTLAEENGLDPEDADDYVNGAIPELTCPLPAAAGKLAVEGRELQLEGKLKEWKDLVLSCARKTAWYVQASGSSIRACADA